MAAVENNKYLSRRRLRREIHDLLHGNAGIATHRVGSAEDATGLVEEAMPGKVEQNVSVECSPLLGPQAVQAVRDLRDGKKLPGRIWTIESIFDQTNAEAALPSRQY